MRGRIAALLMATFLVGCGGSQGLEEEQERATRELQRAEEQLREERQKLERQSRELERQRDPANTSPSADEQLDGSTPERGRVPNVKGKDHQLVQDTLQAAGFYNLSEEDATGKDRPLLFDRNWVVVSQSPKPGTRASLDRTIILRSKKKGE